MLRGSTRIIDLCVFSFFETCWLDQNQHKPAQFCDNRLENTAVALYINTRWFVENLYQSISTHNCLKRQTAAVAVSAPFYSKHDDNSIIKLHYGAHSTSARNIYGISLPERSPSEFRWKRGGVVWAPAVQQHAISPCDYTVFTWIYIYIYMCVFEYNITAELVLQCPAGTEKVNRVERETN